ncbi:hypothetical protein [Methylobacterium sp. 285MFTsu5.1]|uniref:hypothetical protein n=1 Tax=Methylobacterium sp. 285MFTsu5.1 TaxID=1172187 RepID=UPI00037C7F17|nr:hypothetical protein [Methylobacterium sp. 285MFTsu5.1]
MVDSRPHKDDPTIVVRRRVCTDCEVRVTTQESTVDVGKYRARNRRLSKKHRAVTPPDELAAKNRVYQARHRLERAAKDEARETGLSVSSIRARWGLEASQ